MNDALPTHEDAILENLLKTTGIISSQKLDVSISLRKNLADQGVVCSLGEILVKEGYLSPEQFQQLKSLDKIIPGYTILGKIGEGKFGVVYKARQHSMDRTVAIKVLNPELSKSQPSIGRFLREIYVLSKLNHPNIIHGLDSGEVAGMYYVIMEYCDGITIHQYVKANGHLVEDEVLRIGIDLASALQVMWNKNMVHRDINPDNIMIARGQVKLCDLGLVRYLPPPGTESQTTCHLSVNSYAFMPPEQIKGKSCDFRSDVYSLGSVLYFMLTGHYIVEDKYKGDVVPPSRYLPGISANTEAIVLQMVSANPENRCKNVLEIKQGLSQILEKRSQKTLLVQSFGNWVSAHMEVIALFTIFWLLWPIFWPYFKEPVSNFVSRENAINQAVFTPTQIYEKCADGVVLITSKSQTGSGIIISYDSMHLIVTNAHVVEDVLDVQITLRDRRTFVGEVFRSDKLADLTLVKIPTHIKNLNPISLLESDNINVGDDVVVIGHPQGYSWSLTRGAVSGIRAGIIQTDAAINPGSSGCPLLNSQGKVIGITTFRIQNGEGMGFAISASNIRHFLSLLFPNQDKH